jgi:type II secretory ATPase GspE/PulE/Tfp pilus assembly ATPase PilB-like protein
MGQVIDFYSHPIIDENQSGGYVLHGPDMPIATEIFIDLDKSVLLDGCWVPLSRDENGIVVLIDDPGDEEKKASIKTELRTNWVIFKVGTKEDIEAFIHRSFSQLEVDEFLSAAMAGKKPLDEAYLLNTIIADAYLRGVPEIHFAAAPPDKTRVLLLMEGLLLEYMTLPEDTADDIARIIKTIANLDIAENDLPKIGHIKFKHDGLPEVQLTVTTEPLDGTSEYIILKFSSPKDG